MKYDAIIIGGGAAGLCTAVYLKQKMPEISVLVLEKLPRVGKKLAVTGNGRCNITNKNISVNRYHGGNSDFWRYALEKYDGNITEDFFYKIGVPFVFEGDKAYPSSLQAASVVDALRFECEKTGVEIKTDTPVTDIEFVGGCYNVTANGVSYKSDYIVVAAGLYSGGEKLGCDGSVLNILKSKGFNAVKTHPSIVQLKTPPEIVRQLKGIKINANVTLRADGKSVRTEYGETLFCDYGLSGPPVLQISGAVIPSKKCTVSLDILPDKSFDKVYGILSERAAMLKDRTLDEFFTGMLNKRLGQVIIKMSGCKLSDKAQTLNAQEVKKIASNLKNMSFDIIGNTGFVNSQVTSGGLDTTQFSDKSMMAKNASGLFAVGEILDIDGDCGGFNLQWAWSSAMCAADAIIKLYGVKNDNNK